MTKFKLTKTEQKILMLATRSYHGVVSTTQNGSKVSRDLRAIQSLRVKGLMAQQGGGHTEWHSFRTGHTVMYHTTRDAITDEGREVVEFISQK